MAQTEVQKSETAEGNEKKHAAVKRAWYKRIHWWGWILIAIFAVIIGFFGTLGTQAIMVKNHEEKAIAVVKDAVKGGNLSNMSDAISQMQENTKQANEITHNRLWSFVASWPGVGSNIRVAQNLTQIVDDIVKQNAPEYANIATKLMQSKLLSDGSINIEPITEELPALATANSNLMKQLNRINDLEEPSIGIVRNLVNQAKGMVSTADNTLQQVEDVAKELPSYLGYYSPQTYAIMAMTPAEMRMSGGLIGAIGTLTLDRGKFTIGDFRSNPDYVQYGVADIDADSNRIFRAEGPLYMSYDVRDLANYPSTQSTAEAFKTIWDKTPWGENTELDGVILADPVMVQALVKATGDIKLPNGTVLTGSNTAEFLMNTVYKDYLDESDAYFGIVAKECVSKLMSQMDMKTIATLAKDVISLSHQRHFSMYSFNESLEKLLKDSGLSATTPTDKAKPAVGIYLTEQNPSKIDWYIQRSTKVTQICTDSAPYKYHVEYTLHNTLTDEEVEKLPNYLTGELSYNEGTGVEKILFFPPLGGEISNFKVEGTASTPQMDSLYAEIMYQSLAQIRPEQTVTYSFDVTTTKYATSQLKIDQTPMGTEDTHVQYMNSCPAN